MDITELQRLYEAKWTDALKATYAKAHPENCAGPDGSFPIKDASDVSDAAGLYGHAADPDAVKAKIISIARRLGFASALPQTWKDELGIKETDETQTQESISDVASPSYAPSASLTPSPQDTPSPSSAPPPFAPKARIARLKVRWLKNGAQSKNGRIYPRETVQRLVQSGQDTIRDADAQPLTCFTSHAAADNDDVFQLTGMPREIWQDGDDAFAWLDIADTNAGRDMVSLAKGGYLRKMSLRARNAMLEMQPGYDLPVVMGDHIQLEGMDFTTRPGIEVADIQGVLTENAQAEHLTDTFDVDVSSMVLETYTPDGLPLTESLTPSFTPRQEETPMAHATTPQTASRPNRTSSTLLFPVQIPALDANGTLVYESIPMVASKLREAHNKVAGLLKMPCKNAKGGVQEAGRTISKATANTLGEAHNALAMALGTECRYDPDDDGDDDSSLDPSDNPDAQQDIDQGMYTDVGVQNTLPAADPQEHANRTQSSQTSLSETETKGEHPDMTKEELLAQLAAEGFKIEAPKSPEQKVQEEFEAKLEAKLAEQRKEFEVMLAKVAPTTPASQTQEPQRQTLSEAAVNQQGSLVEGGNGTANGLPTQIYTHGSYMREHLHPSKWAALADRTRPLPEGLNPEYALKEMSEVLAGAIVAGFPIPPQIIPLNS